MGVRVTGTDGVSYVNATGLPEEQILPAVRETAAEIITWHRKVKQTPTMFDRVGYDLPENPYESFVVAENAVRLDDVISGLADVTEALAFQGVKWESANMDDSDIYNQVSASLNLDGHLRVMWREMYTYSQVVIAEWWENRTFQVSSSPVSKGRKRRKKYDISVPVDWMALDPAKIVPVGSRLFSNDPIAWSASQEEYEAWLAGTDVLLNTFFPIKYDPTTDEELERLGQWGIDHDRLLLADPRYVYRFTATKPQYKPFADLRLGSTFPLLDMKVQLLKADRVSLVGSANYILLVKKGSKEEPAHQSEIDNLREGFRVVARVPVIVSDHRLSIEIVTPSRDFTLDKQRYEVVDSKIAKRLLGYTDVMAQSANATDFNARIIRRFMENSRHMIRRLVERRIGNAIYDNNPGVFDDVPNLAFMPRHVDIEGSDSLLRTVMELRAKNELSRETTLETVGFDQDVEAVRRLNESESGMDDVFETAIPFNSPEMPRPGDPEPDAQGVVPQEEVTDE